MNISSYISRGGISLLLLALAACQQPLSPDAQRLYEEELAEVRGEQSLTLVAFEQIQLGDKYDDAVRVLGSDGSEQVRSKAGEHDVVIYEWRDGYGRNIALTFHNDVLVSKAQAGLT